MRIMNPFGPPFLLNAEHSHIEDKIKKFSSNLFVNKIYGYLIAIVFNSYLFYCLFKNKNLITIFFEIVLFFLIQSTILVHLFNAQKE